jgi:hypothetical protein
MVAGSCTTHLETHITIMARNAGPVELWGSIHGPEGTPFVIQAIFWCSILPLRRHSFQTIIIQKLLCGNFPPTAAAALRGWRRTALEHWRADHLDRSVYNLSFAPVQRVSTFDLRT